jgi:hypothetical protein
MLQLGKVRLVRGQNVNTHQHEYKPYIKYCLFVSNYKHGDDAYPWNHIRPT